MDFKEECMACVESLQRVGINFLAIDFDDTLVDYHTNGKWRETKGAADLAKKVRPFFIELVPMAMKHGIHVAIVTFSRQVNLIRAVLDFQFPDLASRIPVRGDRNSPDFGWAYEGKGMTTGKQGHMASAAEELNNLYCVKGLVSGGEMRQITRNSSLLLDDDTHNIQSALDNEVRAIYCVPDNIDVTVQEIIALE